MSLSEIDPSDGPGAGDGSAVGGEFSLEFFHHLGVLDVDVLFLAEIGFEVIELSGAYRTQKGSRH